MRLVVQLDAQRVVGGQWHARDFLPGRDRPGTSDDDSV
jgi:hypothetical protein